MKLPFLYSIRTGLGVVVGLFLLSSVSCAKELPVYPIDSAISLVDHHGKIFTAKRYEGKVSLLYFGFTRCPSICPSNLIRLEKAYQMSAHKRNKWQTLFVSVDPDYDKPIVLKNYLQSYKMNAIGLSGHTEQIKAALRNFGASFSASSVKKESSLREKSTHQETYRNTQNAHFFDHSTHIFLIDKNKKVRYLFKRMDSAQKIAGIVRSL